MHRIVLTGGPGAGKTVITHRLAAEHPDRFALVPEAATHVYAVLQTRWDRLDAEGRRNVQRMIYRHQIEQESRLAAAHPNKILLLDRGTLDGAAYWPEGAAAYWQDLQTTHAAELNRYDAVLWLQTAAAINIYDGDGSNACRFEDRDSAIASGEVLKTLWGSHPQFRTINAHPNLEDKFREIRSALHEVFTWPTNLRTGPA
jgi:predicted ATPase